MERIIIDIKDNPQNKDVDKIVKKLRSFLLDEGVISTITVEED